MDPSLFQQDRLLSVRGHASLFWKLQSYFITEEYIRPWYFIIHVMSVFLMFVGIQELSKALFPGKTADSIGYLASAFCVISAMTFAFIPTMDAMMLNRTTVIGLELLALSMTVKGKLKIGFLIEGIVFNLHATTATHTACISFVYCLLNHVSLRRLIASSIFYFIGAAPLLAKMISANNGVGQFDDLWWRVARINFPFHHFIFQMCNQQWCWLAAPLLVLSLSAHLLHHRKIFLLSIGVACCCVLAFMGIEVFRVPQILQLHFYESTRFLNFFANISLAAVLVKFVHNGKSKRILLLCTAIVYLSIEAVTFPLYSFTDFSYAACFILLALVAILFRQRPNNPLETGSVVTPLLLLATVLSLSLAVALIRPSRGLNLTVGESYQRGICMLEEKLPDPLASDAEVCGLPLLAWIQAHTDNSTLFAIPPYTLHPLTSLRLAGRSLFVTFRDGGEGIFEASYAREWYERILAISNRNNLDSLFWTKPGDVWNSWGEMVMEIESGYRDMTDTQRLALVKRYGITHFVIQKSVDEPSVVSIFPKVYEDRVFLVLEVHSN